MLDYKPFKNFFGLDISDFKIRFFQLDSNKKHKKIKSYGEIDVPDEYISHGQINKQTEVSEILKKLISKPKYGKLDSKFVAASLPDKKTFIKVTEIPLVPENEIAGTIRWAIEQNFPIELDKVYYDWKILSYEKDTNKIKVLISASPKSLADSYADLIKSAELTPISLENESIAITRCLVPENENEDPVAILDLGKSRTNFIASYKKMVYYSASIDIGGNELTNSIAKIKKLSFHDAEKAKIIYGLNEKKAKGEIAKIIKPIIVKLIGDIRENIEYFSNYVMPGRKISNVVITGSGSKMVKLAEFLQKELKIKISQGDPLINLKRINLKKQKINDNFQAFSSAIGLALK